MDKFKETIKLFNAVEIKRIPREQNLMADALARLATMTVIKSFGLALVKYLRQSNITEIKSDESQRSRYQERLDG